MTNLTFRPSNCSWAWGSAVLAGPHCVTALALAFLLLVSVTTVAADSTAVSVGDKVVLERPLDDGVTYIVSTERGQELWKDRDLYHFAGYGEVCTVLQDLGTEVLLYVPIMDARYWFTVIRSQSSPAPKK